MNTESGFNIKALHPNFRQGVKIMRTPGGVEFAGDRFYGRECENVVYLRTSESVIVTSTCDEYGKPTIFFADVSISGIGEDGDTGRIALIVPEGTVEVS